MEFPKTLKIPTVNSEMEISLVRFHSLCEEIFVFLEIPLVNSDVLMKMGQTFAILDARLITLVF